MQLSFGLSLAKPQLSTLGEVGRVLHDLQGCHSSPSTFDDGNVPNPILHVQIVDNC